MEELAGKCQECPNCGMLDAIGLTEDVLCENIPGSADHLILANLKGTCMHHRLVFKLNCFSSVFNTPLSQN